MKEIVVLPYGHVLCGEVEDDGYGDIVVREAATFRRWGADREGGGGGLGLLAREGKQPATILDPEGTVRFPRLNVIKRIEIAEAAVPTFGLWT